MIQESTKEVIVYKNTAPFISRLFRKGTINYEVYSKTNFNTGVDSVKRWLALMFLSIDAYIGKYFT